MLGKMRKALLKEFYHRVAGVKRAYRMVRLWTKKRVCFFERMHAVKNLGSNNVIEISPEARLPKSLIRIKGSNNSVHLGKGWYPRLSLEVLSNNCSLFIGDNASLPGSRIVLSAGDGAELCIGEQSSCQSMTIQIYESKKVVLGERCMLSSNIIITTSDAHSVLDSTGKRINPAADVVIGDHVWLGNGVHILKGSEIPSWSIVGAKSLVRSKFSEEGSLLVGSPAVAKKTGLRWDSALL